MQFIGHNENNKTDLKMKVGDARLKLKLVALLI